MVGEQSNSTNNMRSVDVKNQFRYKKTVHSENDTLQKKCDIKKKQNGDLNFVNDL